MQISPLAPMICLFAGACLARFGALFRPRWHGLVPGLAMAIATAAAAAAMLLFAGRLPVTAVALDWRPVTVLGSTASLHVDGTAWMLGLALLVSGLAVALVWLAGSDLESSVPRALTTAMLMAGLGSVFAANILTLALCWGLLDGLFCIALVTQGGPNTGRRVQLALGVNGVATLCVWAVAVMIEQSHVSPYWHLMVLSPGTRMLVGFAAALRLGLYPLHIWQPVELAGRPDRSILVYLVPAMAGLSLWARLAAMQALPGGDVWPIIALVTALVGGVQAWLQSDPDQSLPYLALGYAGMLILAVTMGNLGAATSGESLRLAAGSVSWLLGLTVLFLGQPWTRQTWPWAVPTTVGAASLAGLPLTLGFVTRSEFYRNAVQAPGWIFVLALVAEVFLTATVVRRLLMPTPGSMPASRLVRISYAAGLSVAAAPLIVLGTIPWLTAALSSPMGSASWLAWGLPLVGGALLALRAEPIRERLTNWEIVANRIARLDWLYALLLNAMRTLARVGLVIADVLEGDGAFLWMLIILVLIVLYLRGILGS